MPMMAPKPAWLDPPAHDPAVNKFTAEKIINWFN
jgi:hypothetical protein